MKKEGDSSRKVCLSENGSVISRQVTKDDSNDTRQIKNSRLFIGMVGGKCKSVQEELLAFVNLTKAGFAQNKKVLSWFLWQYGPAASAGTSIRGERLFTP